MYKVYKYTSIFIYNIQKTLITKPNIRLSCGAYEDVNCICQNMDLCLDQPCGKRCLLTEAFFCGFFRNLLSSP